MRDDVRADRIKSTYPRSAARAGQCGLPATVKLPVGVCAMICVFALAGPSVKGQAGEPNARDLLATAAASASWQKCYAGVTDVKYRATDQEGTHQSNLGYDSVVKTFRDNARAHIIVDNIDYLSSIGEVVPRPSRREMLDEPSRRIAWWIPVDKPLSGTVQIAKSAKRLPELKLIDESDPGNGYCLDGKLDGLGSIIDLMIADIATPSATSDVHHERWKDIQCEVVESKTSLRQMSVWIAPAKSNLIVKYRFQTDDPVDGPRMDQFEATTLQIVDGVSVIQAGVCNRTWSLASDRSKWKATVQAQRTKLTFHPDFKQPNLFAATDIPNGVRVFFDDLPDVGVDFVWNNGAPIAKVDAGLFNELGTSIQRTNAGEIAPSSLVPGISAEADTLDRGEKHINQLWLVLTGTAAVSAILLLAIYLGKRNRCVL
jgi:hypothetical protein